MFQITRRTLLKALIKLVAGSGLSAVAGYGYTAIIEPEWLAVERVLIPIKSLPTALEGFKIVHMSDFHLYPYTTLEHIRAVVVRANALKADVICLTGDYVIRKVEPMGDLASGLGKLNAKHGVFSVMGNHDIWTNRVLIEERLKAVGILTLNNSGVSLNEGGKSVWLAGVDSAFAGNPSLPAALEKAPGASVGVLLAHEPDPADTYSLDPRVALQLSGHTHGGQVRIPGIGALILPEYGLKYDCGLYKVRDMWVYTTRGIGVIGPPIRFNCRPEITEIILTAK